MKTHTLSTWPGPFEAVLDGTKRFEYRLDDRGFELGDELVLREWDPSRFVSSGVGGGGGLTGRQLKCRVTYILRGRFGVPINYVVMSIGEVEAM